MNAPSMLVKLMLRRIRSFDHEHGMTIAFETPLTLIVGTNGSGKTTVIECLKYATTGVDPPNSRGGAFIHDPDLIGEKQVKAQVKLSFESTGRANMVLTRNLELTVKRTQRQQKTLEGSLLMVREGERTCISTRVAEMNQLMPNYLGVSKAILEYVIFCHQDDSLWPMSEPSSLKKRFDDIFEAQKYTKAVDNLKLLGKKQKQALDQFKIHEQYAKDTKDKADRAEKKSENLTDEMDKLREISDKLQQEANEAGDKAREARDHAARYTEDIEQLKGARIQREWYAQQLHNLKVNLQERPESDDWLQSELSQYENRLQLHEQREEEQTRRWKEIEQEVSTFRERQGGKRVEHGKYEQEKVTQEKRIQERDAEIKRSASRNNIRGYEMELDDMQINEFMEKVASLSKSQTSKLDQLRNESRAEARKIQESLDSLRDQKTTLEESQRSAKKQISSNEQSIAKFHSQLGKLNVDETGKTIIEAKIQELSDKLEKTKRQQSDSNFATKLKEAKRKAQELEDEAKTLNSQFIQSSNQVTELAQLGHLKKEIKERQKNFETMRSTYENRLKKVVGDDWQPKQLERKFQDALERKQGITDESRSERDNVTKDLAQVQFKRKTLVSEIESKETEIAKCTKVIRENAEVGPEQYLQELEDAQKKYEIAQANIDGFVPMRNYFNTAIDIALETDPDKPAPHCRLCERKLQQGPMLENFVSRLRAELAKNSLTEFEKELRERKQDFELVKDASRSYDTWQRLSETEVPNLKMELSKLDRQRTELNAKVEDNDKIVEDRLEEQRDAELLSKPVSNLVKCFEDLEGLQDQVKSLESESQVAGVSSRSLEDIKEDLDVVGEQQKAASLKLSRLETEEKQIRDHINALLLELERQKNRLMTADHELQEQISINKQVSDLRNANSQQRETVVKISADLDKISPEIEQNKRKLEDVHQRGAEKEKILQKEANQLADDVRYLFRADEEIRAYIREGREASLRKCQREITALDSQIASFQAESKEVIVEINKIKDERANQDWNKRVINDNLNYRKMQRDLQANEDKINRLESQNAEADQEQYIRTAEHWQRKQNESVSLRTRQLAIMNTKDEQLAQLISEWETDYKDAAQNYRKAHIEVETTKAVVEDLKCYGSALDKAIMQFHSLKMEQINATIEELWKATYQGTDVDTILIRSDNESGKGNRSYNYRVCMVKSDVEMDMRGRCSAGQKVLASIIIRLALAECFSEYCGLIALDEPTTNLDRDNIKSLAESLHGIIRTRQAQRNFQLIVITHDEEFLKYMKCADFCDNYYRVYRDASQNSVIERQRIMDVL